MCDSKMCYIDWPAQEKKTELKITKKKEMTHLHTKLIWLTFRPLL